MINNDDISFILCNVSLKNIIKYIKTIKSMINISLITSYNTLLLIPMLKNLIKFKFSNKEIK